MKSIRNTIRKANLFSSLPLWGGLGWGSLSTCTLGWGLLPGLFLTILALLPLAAFAQGQIANFDMSLTDGSITDAVSNKTYKVETGTLPPFTVAGARGEALRLDGYSNYITAKLPEQKLSQMTFSLWCAAETYPMMNTTEAENTVTYTTLAGNLDETNKKGFSLMLSSQGHLKVRFFANGWGPYEIAATEKLPRTQWNHLVVALNNRYLYLYNNGKELGSYRNVQNMDLGTADFMIGKSAEEKKAGPFHINTFCGLIDDITLAGTYDQAVLSDNTPDNAPDYRYPATRYEANSYARLWRPVFHAMPSGAWTNETHGMAYSNGRYHLFFQKNANGPYMARLHWGHLSSANLCEWQEEDIAFGPSETYDIKGCWSGCLYQDPNGQTTAYYTAVDNGKATICSATANDTDLRTWTKATANPLINGRPAGLSDDIRDCYLFNANNQPYMIVGTSKENLGACTLHRLNGGAWTNDGSIFFQAATKAASGRFFEMPNVTPMGGNKYLFTATPLETSVGVETQYWVGNIAADGTFSTLTPLAQPGKLELDGFSRDGFGLLSPTILQHGGKTIALGIVPDKLPTEYNYQTGWAHNYSLPREWTLDGNTLVQKPYSGLAAMRTATAHSLSAQDLAGSQTLGDVRGRAVEVEALFTVGTSQEFGLKFLSDGSSAATLSYTPANGMLKLDLSAVKRVQNDGGTFDGIYQSALPVTAKAGETLKLHVFLDHSIFDIFVNDRWAASVRVFPTDADADGVEVYSTGTTTLQRLNAWILDPAQASTDIQAVPPTASVRDAACYDLMGRRIRLSTPGICIQNGKKVIK